MPKTARSTSTNRQPRREKAKGRPPGPKKGTSAKTTYKTGESNKGENKSKNVRKKITKRGKVSQKKLRPGQYFPPSVQPAKRVNPSPSAKKQGKSGMCNDHDPNRYYPGRVAVTGALPPRSKVKITVKSGKAKETVVVLPGKKAGELQLAQPCLVVRAQWKKQVIKKRFKTIFRGGSARSIDILVRLNEKTGKIFFHRHAT